jgi:type IV secretion system protein VirB9
MIIAKKITICLLLVMALWASADDSNANYCNSFTSQEDINELTTDSRIKTYIYNPSQVYLLVLHYGFQSNIEFAKGEKVQTISLGDTYSWKITPLDNLLFIRPLEKNIRTNMTIITNKNKYQFDLVAYDPESMDESDLVYSIRFYYPKKLKKHGTR